MATAVSVAVFGLYHAGVEMPQTRAHYLAHRLEVLKQMGYPPGSTAAAHVRGSAAGFDRDDVDVRAGQLAGRFPGRPARGDGGGRLGKPDPPRRALLTRWTSLALAVVPVLAVLVCLILTKSRSSYIGFAIGLLALAWCERRRASKKTLLLTALGACL